MALIKCTECKSDVSENAVSCPQCGNPINPIPAQPEKQIKQGDRKCLKCGYVGFMKTWLGNYNFPQFIALIMFLFYVIPGLIFIAWGWGKYKCPACGTVDSNIIAR